MAALALNVSALGFLVATPTGLKPPSLHADRVSWVTATMVGSQTKRALVGFANEVSQRSEDAALPSRQPKSAEAGHQAARASPSEQVGLLANSEGEESRFYAFSEVDQAAQPDSDWNLDPAALDAFGVQAMIFDIFISRTGDVVACRIVEPRTLPDETRVSLENRLRQTVVQPAFRDDIPVASVRRIEISVMAPGS